MRRSLERLAEVNVLNFKLEQQADQSVAFEADSRISLKSEPRLEPATAFDHHDPRRSSSRDSGLQKCVHRCASNRRRSNHRSIDLPAIESSPPATTMASLYNPIRQLNCAYLVSAPTLKSKGLY